MRALEEAAFARGASPEALMEEAGRHCAQAVLELHAGPGTCLVVFGKGNNGGDALVAARHLSEAGWKTHLVPAFPEESWGELPRRKFAEAGLCEQHPPGVRSLAGVRPDVILDGLLGIGSQGPLREPLAGMVRAVNALRAGSAAEVFSIDLPTGLESGESVVADFTLTIGACKAQLVADWAAAFVGRLVLLPLGALPLHPSLDQLATPLTLAPLLRRRSFDTHKGQCGRVAIVAGSLGLTGAARMCSEACVRGGAGLITLYVPHEAYAIVAASTAPEVMVHGVKSYFEVLEAKHDVLAIGPGLGQSRRAEVLSLMRETKVPAVIDADALNLLATDLPLLSSHPAPRLLTPHPREMARLDPSAGAKPRAQAARDFVGQYPVTLLLKGSRTVIAEAGRPLSYNSTGNPGMATGGMGDLLTGVCAALAGQGIALYDCARLGAWVCGRAAELALTAGGESEESLTPVDLLAQLGGAFRALRARGY